LSETLVSTYESTRRHNPEEHRHLYRRENLRSHKHCYDNEIKEDEDDMCEECNTNRRDKM